ncbi:unnamed protein product [Pieris brassicae]|uniref:Uncharacterized protein n=1 Tax=Pieris brassicae TaxID=7116 RepID=A0A9P0TXB8_PIEBR|nr:unnamed protein product [Pieris brassicae]
MLNKIEQGGRSAHVRSRGGNERRPGKEGGCGRRAACHASAERHAATLQGPPLLPRLTHCATILSKSARVRMSRWHCTLAEVALPLHPTPLVLENWVKQHTALPHRKRGFGQSCASTNAGQRCD